MLTLWGEKHKLCGGLTRRGFLKIGGLGAGLTPADMLRQRAGASGTATPRPKSVIMVCLFGGPPHTDTYDLKPDAPAEYRGPFQPIETSAPGVRLSQKAFWLDRRYPIVNRWRDRG